jgi:hypothetical protein
LYAGGGTTRGDYRFVRLVSIMSLHPHWSRAALRSRAANRAAALVFAPDRRGHRACYVANGFD